MSGSFSVLSNFPLESRGFMNISLYFFILRKSANECDVCTNRSLRDVQSSEVLECWFIMICRVRCKVRGVRWSLCPHPAPSCQQLSEPEWSNSSSVCRPQSPLEPVPRLPPTNRQMVNTDGCNYHTRTYTSSAHQSTAVQSHLINFQV